MEYSSAERGPDPPPPPCPKRRRLGTRPHVLSEKEDTTRLYGRALSRGRRPFHRLLHHLPDRGTGLVGKGQGRILRPQETLPLAFSVSPHRLLRWRWPETGRIYRPLLQSLMLRASETSRFRDEVARQSRPGASSMNPLAAKQISRRSSTFENRNGLNNYTWSFQNLKKKSRTCPKTMFFQEKTRF